jgi:hypothetical protein
VAAKAPRGLPAVHWRDFEYRVLVNCPACGGVAVVSPDSAAKLRRFVCQACPKRDELPGNTNSLCGLELRLVIPTRHGNLVALNEAHLDYLAAYIGQTLRKELVSPDSWKNRSQASRLPAWAKAAGNREEILKAIARTRASRLQK